MLILDDLVSLRLLWSATGIELLLLLHTYPDVQKEVRSGLMSKIVREDRRTESDICLDCFGMPGTLSR
jgi:hypothetical protein